MREIKIVIYTFGKESFFSEIHFGAKDEACEMHEAVVLIGIYPTFFGERRKQVH